jgi:hypothetical protein
MSDDVSPPIDSRKRLIRAGSLGLGLAAFIAGVAFVYLGLRPIGVPDDCEARLQECALEQEIAEQMARIQSLIGLALILLCAAIFLAIRQSDRRASTGPQ